MTPRSVAIYQRMLALAADSDERDALDDQLRDELQIAPWCFPTLEGSDAVNIYPVGTVAHDWHPLAQALRSKLDRAAKEKARRGSVTNSAHKSASGHC